MAVDRRALELAEVDAFLVAAKTIEDDSPMTWAQSSRQHEMQCIWNLADDLGIVRGAIRFKYQKTYARPSISIIFREHSIYRLDLVEPEVIERNPPGAAMLGLPARVHGSHCHAWADNREYVRINGFAEMPYRRPLQPQIRKLPQALAWLAASLNITLNHEQRAFDVPDAADLFEVLRT